VDTLLTVITWIALAAVILGVLAMFGGEAGNGCLVACLGICFLVGKCYAPELWQNFKDGDKHDQMMKSCFDSAPQLKTTLDNLQAEVNRWQDAKEKFTRMRDAAQTSGGRSLAELKLARIDVVLNGLKDSRYSVLEQVEMIAMESAGQFTELDRKALKDLSRRVESSVRDARELRKGLSGG